MCARECALRAACRAVGLRGVRTVCARYARGVRATCARRARGVRVWGARCTCRAAAPRGRRPWRRARPRAGLRRRASRAAPTGCALAAR
eukprot:1929208-Prymnesium_polylepis.1